MVYLTYGDHSLQNKDLKAVSIIKGTKNKYFNKLIYLSSSNDLPNKKDKFSKFECPLTNFFNILPSTDQDTRDIFYIAGGSGSGKSYIAKQIAEAYYKLYPDRNIFLISKLEEDNTIDSTKAPIKRLDYKEFINEPLDINKISNSMVIFDDYDTIEGKEGKVLIDLIKDIAIMGRKHTDNQGNITMLLLTHFLTNYSKTRLLLNEASHFVVYPQNTSYHHLYYLLKNYMGLDKEEVKRLKKLGRWVCFKKQFPQLMISQQEIKLLNVDDDDEPEMIPKRRNQNKNK